jgi:hypothetical protein
MVRLSSVQRLTTHVGAIMSRILVHTSDRHTDGSGDLIIPKVLKATFLLYHIVSILCYINVKGMLICTKLRAFVENESAVEVPIP